MAAQSKPENARARKPLTQERLKYLLRYDPETGVWTWIAKSSRATVIGVLAGSRNDGGYLVIRIDRRSYRASNLAFLYMTGELPDDEVDHWDCDPSNDRWANLRPSTSAQNKWNTRVSKNSRSGLKGAFWHSYANKWRSQIMRHGKLYSLGLFETAEEAHAAYAAKARELFGEFARSE